jgi:hypothetical protein
LYRLGSQAVIIPFRDSVIAGLQEIAIAGAEFGREQVERHVFGVKAVGPDDIPLPVASGAALAIDWQLANNAAAEWARRYGYELVRGMNDTTASIPVMNRRNGVTATAGDNAARYIYAGGGRNQNRAPASITASSRSARRPSSSSSARSSHQGH